jgi:SAM-dependent methyltransferase
MGLDQVRAEWDAAADTFDLEADHGLLDPGTREAWQRLLRSLLPSPPARVVDLGCGTGTLAVLLAEDGHDVTGVDLSPRMIRRARAKARAAGAPARFAIGDASRPALTRGAFDVVLARHVVWALPDAAASLRAWADLLAPHGRLVLVEGRWGNGSGLSAGELRAMVGPLVREVAVTPLTDEVLWGKGIDDERYALVGAT